MKDDKPILDLCDIRILIYKSIGHTTFQKYTNPVHYINHTYVLQYYLNPIVTTNAENKDFMVTPSKEMRRAIEVLLVNIMDGLLVDSQDCLYKFKATIVDILNKDEQWYSFCKKCNKKVKVIEHTISCNNCNNENIDYEMRLDLVSFERKCAHYAAEKIGPLKWLSNETLLICRGFDENVIHAEKTIACGGEQCARVILFEAAKYILGCSVQDYIESTSVKI
ncbi:hypothetical protein H5410_058483 [Solanum commersonii]|uniref:Replication factor A C-terminal domain-containing protein n=1 Tax=Solanum commersonii TaxID=4109 RepID=A0A9J5WST4_SOLCO|nr:hypothetical protein H5410_058483 [Solanum commersonii]